MTFSVFGKFAAVSLLLMGIAPAHAQNNKPIRSGTFYEDRASANSLNLIQTITFAQTPADKFLNITNIACNIVTSASQAMSALTFFVGSVPGADDFGRDYSIRGSVTPELMQNDKYYSIVTNQVFYKIGPGRFPSIMVSTVIGAGTVLNTAQCVIVGNLTDS